MSELLPVNTMLSSFTTIFNPVKIGMVVLEEIARKTLFN